MKPATRKPRRATRVTQNNPPNSRKLRIYSFDPGLASSYGMAKISEITIKVPWEDLEKGPIGEYIEVVDVDPPSGMLYRPVDLNDPALLAQDGLAPSEGNPQFHQQMVYAVAMTTIGHFERALGRVALWSSYRDRKSGKIAEKFVRRLRIYPHALRDGNAYYSPEKKALLFGYFPVEHKDAYNTPGTIVFTCLSHDIVAHETTHALLDGVHPRFNEPVNPDVLAFHEAFADIVALFQHFTYPGVLRDQIARTRGNLKGENMLAQLAQQFGRATQRGGALRDALGTINPKTGDWEPRPPKPDILEALPEPHDRGAILVAAIFGAFAKVYDQRTADLYRIATDGTGVLREGDIHPDLCNRLAEEASRIAAYVLSMCIRAIDYCPPVGITLGDYLRAVVTADYDFNADDEWGFRLAFVESFRQWGIHPRNMRSMSVESLLWPSGKEAFAAFGTTLSQEEIADDLGLLFDTASKITDTTSTATRKLQADAAGDPNITLLRPWDLESDRYETWVGIRQKAVALWYWLVIGSGRRYAESWGLVLDKYFAPQTVFRSPSGDPNVEVHSVRTAQRRTARGSIVTDLVVEITQRRRGYFDPEVQAEKDKAESFDSKDKGDFRYRAGCTVLIDPVRNQIRRVIRTPGTIADDNELHRQRVFLTDGGLQPPNAYDVAARYLSSREPFALLHSGET